MLRAIRVYGALREFLGQSEFLADVSTPAEAIRFLVANFPHVEAHMADRHYKVLVGGHRVPANEQLHAPSGADVIRLVPTVAGAGDVGKILLGVALVGLVIATGGAAGFLGGAALSVGLFGGALILGGVVGLLTPTPTIGANDPKNDPKRAESFNFSGISNVSRQGLPVPIIYGETIVGSVTISVGISSEQVAV